MNHTKDWLQKIRDGKTLLTFADIEQILKNQVIVKDIAKCVKSEVQNGRKTMSLNRLSTLLRGADYDT